MQHVSVSLSDRRDSCVAKACSLFILEKGKSVVRPRRKAKGRRLKGRRKPGCRKDATNHFGGDDEGVTLTRWDPEDESQAGAGEETIRRFA